MNKSQMPYARARLMLGIAGVGSIVLFSLVMLIADVPRQIFSTATHWQWADPFCLAGLILGYMSIMAPFDFLGGYLLPRRFGRSSQRFGSYLQQWTSGILLQAVMYLSAGMTLLFAGRAAGAVGVATALLAILCVFLFLQQRIATANRVEPSGDDAKKIAEAISRLQHLDFQTNSIVVKRSDDVGFTGGVVGFPGYEKTIVPATWVEQLSADQLAAVLARRFMAVSSGSRSRGLLFAGVWVVVSFFVASVFIGGPLTSISGLVATILGFNLLTFLGLLTLPTISRQASYAIDHQVVEQGIGPGLMLGTIQILDRLQDDEPERSRIIESIFHPIPSMVNRRFSSPPVPRLPIAWHVARMAVFFSGAGVGFLSRAVHCNVGRPDLWLMLPAD